MISAGIPPICCLVPKQSERAAGFAGSVPLRPHNVVIIPYLVWEGNAVDAKSRFLRPPVWKNTQAAGADATGQSGRPHPDQRTKRDKLVLEGICLFLAVHCKAAYRTNCPKIWVFSLTKTEIFPIIQLEHMFPMWGGLPSIAQEDNGMRGEKRWTIYPK